MRSRHSPTIPFTLEIGSSQGLEFTRAADEALLALLFCCAKQRPPIALAQRLLHEAGGLDGLAKLGPSVLASYAGVGPVRAARLCAAFELGQRRWLSQPSTGRFDSLESVLAWARPRLLLLDHEEVWLLCLDARGAMRTSRRIAQGGHHSCALSARDILRPALRDGACSIILVHNHPSGDPTPSDADVEMTAQIDVACAAVGLPLLDHVVVAADGAASLLELGVVHAR